MSKFNKIFLLILGGLFFLSMGVLLYIFPSADIAFFSAAFFILFSVIIFIIVNSAIKFKKAALIIFCVLFGIFFIVYITDSPPVITFKVTPENPKDIREVKVYITAVDDRCLRGSWRLEAPFFNGGGG